MQLKPPGSWLISIYILIYIHIVDYCNILLSWKLGNWQLREQVGAEVSSHKLRDPSQAVLSLVFLGSLWRFAILAHPLA